jgi:hypothetical protein
MPMIVAREVMSIGRRRIRQAVITAFMTVSPFCSNRWANSTIRILFEAVIPTSMSTPISDITFSVVCVSGSMIRTPIKPIGTASIIRKGSLKELNCATRIR